MANCSQFLRCRVIALPLKLTQLLLLLLQLPPCVLREVTCPTPRSVEHADIQVKSHSVKSRERYVCNSGFKRQAGTSNLIQCMLDQNSNTARWTETNLKCIRDPALVHQKPTNELLTPDGKGFTVEPEASKSDTTVATETVMVSTSISLSSSIHTAPPALAGTVSKPVSKEISSEPPSATVIITTRNWSFTILAQTTTQTVEQSSPSTHGIITAAQRGAIVSASVVVSISILGVILIYIYHIRRRNPIPEHSVEMEEMPMRGETDNKEEGVES
ncbi:interleukin-15 receptor subunit alpha [Trichosurus vulpecula]|uniref:interleukin-15 receptor subunit alpha n=1 Tax=Trichosurus vulpecula TaxID=9337 RepID=UPI00186B1615|nr:interleukin-15 receptor subunit alpha [Trichosurus vulpecula]